MLLEKIAAPSVKRIATAVKNRMSGYAGEHPSVKSLVKELRAKSKPQHPSTYSSNKDEVRRFQASYPKNELSHLISKRNEASRRIKEYV